MMITGSKGPLVPMTNDELQRYVPAAFATEPHGAVSEKYRFIPTINVMNALREFGWEPVRAVVANPRDKSKNGFQKHLITMQNQKFDLRTKEGDVIEAHLINSHDRSCAYTIMVGAYRLICSNGLVIAIERIGDMKIRHIGFDDYDVANISQNIIENVPSIVSKIDEWGGVRMSPEQMEQYASSAMKVRWDEKKLEQTTLQPYQILTANRAEDQKSDLWTVYNRVQENLVRGGSKFRTTNPDTGKRRNSTVRAVKGIDQNMKLNQSLWSLTEKTAAALVG